MAQKNFILISFEPRCLIPFANKGFIRELLVCKEKKWVFKLRFLFESVDLDKDVMKSQDEIQETKIQISVASVQGTSDKGVDIAELREHKVIVAEKPVEEKPFVTVEQMPTFPGGEIEMQKFIRDNLRYPVVAQEAGIQGRVTLRFVVSKTGTIEDIIVTRGIDPSCDKEAVRVVRSMPKWTPGKQNGLPVNVYFTLPITFRLTH